LLFVVLVPHPPDLLWLCSGIAPVPIARVNPIFNSNSVFEFEHEESGSEADPETEVNSHDAPTEESVNSLAFFKDGAAQHPALATGFDMRDLSSQVSEEMWADLSMLAAAAIHACVEETLDRVRTLKMLATGEHEVSRAVSRISGNMLQFNLTYTVLLMNWLGSDLDIKSLTATLRKELKCTSFCFQTLVRKVESNKHLLAMHLSQVAADTLSVFSLDEEVSLLLSDYVTKTLVPTNQMWHTDNRVGGSYFNLIFFGCGRFGARYRGNVPCTAVCTYPNIAEISMRGDGWPLNWRVLQVGTPEVVSFGTSIVVPANVIHAGVGKPTKQKNIPDGLDIRCVFFRMARHPECDPFFDVEVDGGAVQMYEFSYLWGLRLYGQMCESLCNARNKEWSGRVGSEYKLRWSRMIRRWRARKISK
jgi:hypothetical protein